MTRIPFILLSTSDGSPLTGATPSVTISKDGAAFAAATNTPAEIGNGYYYIDLTATETTVNNNVIVRATATGAQPTAVVWEPEQAIPTAADNATAVWAAQTKEVTIATAQADTFATATSVANIATVAGEIKAKTDKLPQSPAAVGSEMALTNATISAVQNGLATSSELSALETHGDTYWHTASTAGLATGQGLENLATYGDAHWSTADVSGLATQTDITDAVTALETYGDGKWQTADVSDLATSSELSTAESNIVSAMPTADIAAIKAGLYNWELVKDGSTESITAKSGISTVAQSTITRNSAGEIIKMEETE